MPRRVLVDTGVLYALIDPSDQYHVRAHREAALLAGWDVLLAYPILLESYSLVLQRLGRQVAGQYLAQASSSFSIVNVITDDYQAAIDLIDRYGDQVISLFDAVLAVLSERLDVMLWTFDSDFDVLRVPVWREGMH